MQLRPDEEVTVEDLIETVEEADGRDGFAVAVTGEFTTDRDFNEVSQRATSRRANCASACPPR